MDDKFAVRAIIFDEEMNTPILSVGNGRYYKIPGGTIENGESEKEALAREIKEEAGCSAEIVSKLGEYSFQGKESGRMYHSVFYLAKLVGERGKPSFDDWEKERSFKLLWVPIDKAIRTFELADPKDKFERIINNRDLSFLKKAKVSYQK
jgi:8-oxo-dGTP diphosphatase